MRDLYTVRAVSSTPHTHTHTHTHTQSIRYSTTTDTTDLPQHSNINNPKYGDREGQGLHGTVQVGVAVKHLTYILDVYDSNLGQIMD